jgi:hypothetical protein
MYINFKLLLKHKIKAGELLLLQGLKQKEYDLFFKSENTLNCLEEKGYLKKIGKKTYKDFRLSEKGSKFLKDLQVAEITEDSKRLAMNLISLYEEKGFKITNKKKIVELCAWFLSEVDYSVDDITTVVADYLNITEIKYTSSLQNLIWKGDNVFSNNWSLSQSKLYGLLT